MKSDSYVPGFGCGVLMIAAMGLFFILGISNALPYSEVRVVKRWDDSWARETYRLEKKCIFWFEIDWTLFESDAQEWKSHYYLRGKE